MMRKFLAVIFSWVFFYEISFAGIGPTAVWELNPGASNASTQQGCVFEPAVTSPGTDYSQQMTAQVSFTDLWVDPVITNFVSSTANPFTSDMVGNGIKMTAGTGFITGATSWYIITAVNNSTATVDRPIGLAGSQNGSGKLGGACALNSTQDDNLFEAMQSSNTAWVHSGNYTLGVAVTVVNDAAETYPINIIGYRATRGDNPAIGTQPVINSGANTFSFTGANSYQFSNLEVTGTANPTWNIGSNAIFRNNKASNTSSSALRPTLNPNLVTPIINSVFTSPAGIGINANISNNFFYGNLIYNSSICIQIGAANNNITFINNLLSFCNSTGIASGASATAQNIFVNNTIYCSSSTSSTGFYMGTASLRYFFINNIVSNCAIAVTTKKEEADNYFYNNNYFGNTVNFSSTTTNQQRNAYFLDPGFANTTSWDVANFSVGTNMKGLGMPSAFGQSASTGAIDMGAVQRVESTSAGGTRSYPFGN